jgi:8-oxo-dGTP diphosphatase
MMKNAPFEYTCGFMFSEDRKKVLLIQKDRPEWQAGRVNGIGGKIDLADKEIAEQLQISYPLVAMVREFREETGIVTTPDEWEQFATMEGNDSKIHLFKAFSNKLFSFEQKESEKPLIIGARDIYFFNHVPNLTFIANMALDTQEVFNINCQIKG